MVQLAPTCRRLPPSLPAFALLALAVAATSGTAAAQPVLVLPDPEVVVQPIDLSRFADRHWDFEDGTLQGFTHQDVPGGTARTGAFHNQPTFGDNVSAPRALNTSGLRLPPNPCAGLIWDLETDCIAGAGATFNYLQRLRGDLDRLRGDLQAIGGSYWMAPFPIGTEGRYWIGTYESRPSRRIDSGTVPGRFSPRPLPWGTVQGDARTGRLVSQPIELHHRYFHLLVGGGCSEEVGVYLQGQRPMLRRGSSGMPEGLSYTWETLDDADGEPIAARGYCLENMVRVSFDLRHLAGRTVRILIEDRASGNWGHINVDDVWLSNRPPQPSSRSTDPVFGVADLHGHLMNELGFMAFDESGSTPESRALWGSALGPLSTLQRCNNTHTTSDWEYTPFLDPVHGSTYTLCRDVCLNQIEGGGLPEGNGDQIDQDGGFGGYHAEDGGHPRFVHWPMWYSATHQQMHWSWVHRAYRGGLRLMIATVGNSEVVSFGLVKEPERPFLSDQDALALQIPAIHDFARRNSTWAEVAYTPADARRIVNSGKLALVIGVELDHVMDTCAADVTSQRHHVASIRSGIEAWALQNGVVPGALATAAGFAPLLGASSRVVHFAEHPATCSPAQIEARLDALYRAGVRQIVPLHFSDNMLGGYALTGDLFLASAIFGHRAAGLPRLMEQSDLEARYGAAARPFQPVAREVYPRENEDRERRWRDSLPVRFKLGEAIVPIWATLAGGVMDASMLPPGASRSSVEFFTGRCIEDEGLRWIAGLFSGGLSEVNCGVSTVTDETIESVRRTMPFSGAFYSPAMLPFDLDDDRRALPFHVNARTLSAEGRTFVRQMMRRGMLIDLQHSSDRTKNDILAVAGPYPVMASHGTVRSGGPRDSENVLTATQLERVYSPPESFAAGLVGLGTQSSEGLVEQLRRVATGGLEEGERREVLLHTRGVALGTDLNGLDWHAAPRFGQFGFYADDRFHADDPSQSRAERKSLDEVGPMVRYAPYPTASNPWASTSPVCEPACPDWNEPAAAHPPLNPSRVTSGRSVTRTFDINFDGLAHYGLIPDFLQEISVLGTSREEMGAVFRSAEALIRMWEESCFLAHHSPEPPRSLQLGCGGRHLYD